ncbi:hypothetical protein P280DRAFT_481731 [Massarina eburnea CBS 473.64]|uniref:Uncharacterized protein n=1 Tax=Massarina eburnea CBS 473.64 TaxID=1395130 RepID=A0A6A6RV95_9PLEO|nr:hypothetical protein P280DRAFT_481731 [Massarina eburnea CBS 473.64]
MIADLVAFLCGAARPTAICTHQQVRRRRRHFVQQVDRGHLRRKARYYNAGTGDYGHIRACGVSGGMSENCIGHGPHLTMAAIDYPSLSIFRARASLLEEPIRDPPRYRENPSSKDRAAPG